MFTFKDHVRVIVSCLSNNWYFEVDEEYLCGHICVTSLLHLFSKSLSIVLRCGCLLLNVIFSFSSARCIRWLGFTLIRVSYRCVIDVMLQDCVFCTRLIRTRIIVCSVSFHLLWPEFDIPELRPLLIHWSSKYHGIERSNLQGVSCWIKRVCGMTFPRLCLISERLMGLREQSTVGCFTELCFSVFRGVGVCGVGKEIYTQFGFSNLILCCWF